MEAVEASSSQAVIEVQCIQGLLRVVRSAVQAADHTEAVLAVDTAPVLFVDHTVAVMAVDHTEAVLLVDTEAVMAVDHTAVVLVVDHTVAVLVDHHTGVVDHTAAVLVGHTAAVLDHILVVGHTVHSSELVFQTLAEDTSAPVVVCMPLSLPQAAPDSCLQMGRQVPGNWLSLHQTWTCRSCNATLPHYLCL